MNPNQFLKRWIQGMKDITPIQALHAKTICYLGGSIGLTLALLTMIITKIYYFSVFLIFMIALQIIEFLTTRKAWREACKAQDEIESNPALKELMGGK